MSPTPHRLQVDGVSRRFGPRTVLDNVSLTVGAGQFDCLLGPSGCGKSTLLRIIAGVDRQSAGAVRADGRVLSDAACHVPPEARGIGLMFQDFALFPHLTVARNIGFGLARGPARRERVGELLARIEMTGFGDKYPHELSGGEQQRVALARALAPRPGILLMDEPFSGLDNRLRDEVRDATLSILKAEGAAVLMVTHEPEEAMRMADQILLMRAGRIVQRGAPYNIYNTPVDRAAAAFFSDINVITARVKSMQVDTPFGRFLMPGLADGTKVEIVIRPQHLRIDFDRGGRGPNPTMAEGTPALGHVERARFLGAASLVEFRMGHDGSVLKATVPGVFLPSPGKKLWLSLRRDRCLVFHDGQAEARRPGAAG